MRSWIAATMLILGTLLGSEPADAGIMCTWFGRCLYESPGFQITVVDKETGRPLADVHALAEWVQHGFHGRNGPLMVQDAVSGPDGVLSFPTWGPIQGSRAGLVINSDPVLTLFKPGYNVLLLNNAVPIGVEETDRVHGFSLGIQSSALELFRGTAEEWVKELGNAAYPATKGQVADEQLLRFRRSYLNRMERVLSQGSNLPGQYKEPGQFFWHIARSIKFYQGVQE